ncbi:transcription elongation factor GreAB [Clostridium estertheticum]|uniref:transcription elongation factor GreAB n=1 Tax=Clostridium estertheticum TaxID=238834 RepID=UPI001C0E652C|nr:transcription elongation factor GreAB [Clostridium estertheticum]MBU3186221.1 transcription elongation factor GreAB [Clostridium estertheticum]
MKRIRRYSLLVTILSVITIFGTFTACSKSQPQPQSEKTNPYNGRTLNIGVIGEPPNVREKQVTFVKIKFSDLEKNLFSSQYDTIFITKNNLSEASQGKYASIYKKSKIPFFFIQTEKSYVPFVMEDLTYDNAPTVTDQTYATGILYTGAKLNTWGYGLYNDIENQANIKDVYSRIFETILKNATSK